MTVLHEQPDDATRTAALGTVLRRAIADPTASWSLGTFGAIAEFHRTSDEPASITTGATLQVVTARGALRLRVTEDIRACAYELPGPAGGWNHAVALCLPATSPALPRHSVLTECGPDHDALRPHDRAAVLFDLGLGTAQVTLCVRSADAEGLTWLRAGCGRALLAPDNPLMQAMSRLSPHRVFVCPFARLEVYQRIPGHGETPPEGPHTHVLPRLLRHQRSHAATAPIPHGWVPCLHLYPANPVRDALDRPRPFDHVAHEAFQTLLRDFGDPELVRLKEAVTAAVLAGQAPESFAPPASRAGRTTVRVALRQLAHTNGHCPVLAAWRHAFDRTKVPA
jgi:hypothetical protein